MGYVNPAMILLGIRSNAMWRDIVFLVGLPLYGYLCYWLGKEREQSKVRDWLPNDRRVKRPR